MKLYNYFAACPSVKKFCLFFPYDQDNFLSKNVLRPGSKFGWVCVCTYHFASEIQPLSAKDPKNPCFNTVIYTSVYRSVSYDSFISCFSSDRSFEYLFEKWGLQCHHVHLHEFTEHIQVACRQSECHPTHEIQMLIIKPRAAT